MVDRVRPETLSHEAERTMIRTTWLRELASKLMGDLGHLQSVVVEAGLTTDERLQLADELEELAGHWATGRARLLEVIAELRRVDGG